MDKINASLFPEMIEWEGPDAVDLVDWWLGYEHSEAGLNSLFLFKRSGSLAVAVSTIGALDKFTPENLKNEAYYAFIAIIGLASMRPFDVLYIPKQYEKIVTAIIENPKQLRRTVKEADLIGVLQNREFLKTALKFLCDKKILEPIGSKEYLISRRPVLELKITGY
jgi:hypothetical protein